MKIEQLKNQKILVLGLGREGQATVRFLKEHGLVSKITLADQRKREDFRPDEKAFLDDAENNGMDLKLGENYLHGLTDYQVIIKSPGISVKKTPSVLEAVKAGVKLTSATNIFFTNIQGKTIAVTGSKGKSTTASLIAAVLKEAELKVELVGNIGKAALAAPSMIAARRESPDFLKEDSADKYYVYEVSSYQLEDFTGSPDIAVLVSFFPEHLDYHGDEKAYLEAKMQIVTQLKQTSKVIYNFASEKLRREIMRKFGVEQNEQVITFNNGENSKLDAANNVIIDGEKIIDSAEVVLLGAHNLENILAVCEVAKVLNIALEKVAKVARTFKGLEHRLEEVGQYKGILFYNDAISTTPESTMAALEAMKMVSGRKGIEGVGTLIAGGLDRGYQFEQLAERIVEDGVRNLILFPETGVKIAEEVTSYAGRAGKNLPRIVEIKTMGEAVGKAFELTEEKMICLLSCASPSYNLFKNFEDRGNQFKNLVMKIGTGI